MVVLAAVPDQESCFHGIGIEVVSNGFLLMELCLCVSFSHDVEMQLGRTLARAREAARLLDSLAGDRGDYYAPCGAEEAPASCWSSKRRWRDILSWVLLIAAVVFPLGASYYTIATGWGDICPVVLNANGQAAGLKTMLYHSSEVVIFVLSAGLSLCLMFRVRGIMRLLDIGRGGSVNLDLAPWDIYTGIVSSLGIFRLPSVVQSALFTLYWQFDVRPMQFTSDEKRALNVVAAGCAQLQGCVVAIWLARKYRLPAMWRASMRGEVYDGNMVETIGGVY